MENLRLYNFARHRMGDKINACYQLSYYKEFYKNNFLLIDPGYNDPTSFPVKYFFPQLGEMVLEISGKNEETGILECDEIFNHLKPFIPELSFGNLWISAPSLKQDTDYLPHMHIPAPLKEYQKLLKTTKDNQLLDTNAYSCIIVNHCLSDVAYNHNRRHNINQWDTFFSNLKSKYAEKNVLIIDLPREYVMPAVEIISIIDLADIYVGGDTGFTHAAAALGKEIVAIYGDDSSDVRDFENERIRMKQSHVWCSDPISNSYKKFVMENNLFDEKEVLGYIETLINKKIEIKDDK